MNNAYAVERENEEIREILAKIIGCYFRNNKSRRKTNQMKLETGRLPIAQGKKWFKEVTTNRYYTKFGRKNSKIMREKSKVVVEGPVCKSEVK